MLDFPRDGVRSAQPPPPPPILKSGLSTAAACTVQREVREREKESELDWDLAPARVHCSSGRQRKAMGMPGETGRASRESNSSPASHSLSLCPPPPPD